jgi:hypothetical protein
MVLNTHQPGHPFMAEVVRQAIISPPGVVVEPTEKHAFYVVVWLCKLAVNIKIDFNHFFLGATVPPVCGTLWVSPAGSTHKMDAQTWQKRSAVPTKLQKRVCHTQYIARRASDPMYNQNHQVLLRDQPPMPSPRPLDSKGCAPHRPEKIFSKGGTPLVTTKCQK